MSERSDIDGRYWFPLGTQHRYGKPEPGWLVAIRHEAWLIVEVREVPVPEQPEPPRGDPSLPPPIRRVLGQHYAVRVRPARLANHPDPVKARRRDRHLAANRTTDWRVFPDPEHYPVCACCGDPMPCRAETGRRMAEQAIAKMGRYDQPGVCPACEQPLTARQKFLTFDDNVEVPAGPPVTFHLRGKCIGDAAAYERRWAAAAPGRRRTLSCDGDIVNHNDGTYECTALDACPGAGVAHPASASMCMCPSCHNRPWTWGRGCHPDPRARRRGADEPSPPSQRALFNDPDGAR